jgi:alpha-amylase
MTVSSQMRQRRRDVGCLLSVLALACTRGDKPVSAIEPYPDGDHETDDESVRGERDAATSGDGDGAGDGDGDGDGDVPARTPVPSPGAVFVHLFEWRWADIAEECERYLGPAGVEAVQISPPSEHALIARYRYPWWQRYQTVSYDLARSRSGTREELADMIARCARVGVGIYVDAVINHMTAGSGTGSNGSEYTKYEYPPLYTEADFHQPHCDISDADWVESAANVQNCELLDLSDLDTGKASVQDKIAAYLQGLVELGVRGFRIDAAKHTAPADLRAITGKVRAKVSAAEAPYYYFEVFTFGGEAVAPVEYLALEDTLGAERAAAIEFRYSLVGNYFRGGAPRPAELKDFATGFMPSERAIVFVNNHDTQRNDGLFYQDGARFDLATIYMLAAPYGYPSLMSSYAFVRPSGRDIGPPSDEPGQTRAVYAAGESEPDCASEQVPEPGSWVCEHRRAYVPGMIAFRRATAGSDLTRWWDDGADRIAFGRGERGFVVINAAEDELTRSFDTGLPEGRYCDAVRGVVKDGSCSGRVIDVDASGKMELTVEGLSAAALHVGAKL